jgi:hypothetical protein
MPLDLTDRRASDKLTEAIDNALDLAEECGWRYALAFLISEEVPAEIIQRLLSGGGRARELPKGRSPVFQKQASGWKGRNTEAMVKLFASLRGRGFAAPCPANQAPLPSRSSLPATNYD